MILQYDDIKATMSGTYCMINKFLEDGNIDPIISNIKRIKKTVEYNNYKYETIYINEVKMKIKKLQVINENKFNFNLVNCKENRILKTVSFTFSGIELYIIFHHHNRRDNDVDLFFRCDRYSYDYYVIDKIQSSKNHLKYYGVEFTRYINRLKLMKNNNIMKMNDRLVLLRDNRILHAWTDNGEDEKEKLSSTVSIDYFLQDYATEQCRSFFKNAFDMIMNNKVIYTDDYTSNTETDERHLLYSIINEMFLNGYRLRLIQNIHILCHEGHDMDGKNMSCIIHNNMKKERSIDCVIDTTCNCNCITMVKIDNITSFSRGYQRIDVVVDGDDVVIRTLTAVNKIEGTITFH